VQGLIQWIVLLGYDEEVADGSEIDSLINDDAFLVERNEAAIERFERGAGIGVVHTTFPILWDGEGFVEPDEFWSEFFNNHPYLFKGRELAISNLTNGSPSSQDRPIETVDGSGDSFSSDRVPSLVDRCRVVTVVPVDQVLDIELLADAILQIRNRLEKEVEVDAILGLIVPDKGS